MSRSNVRLVAQEQAACSNQELLEYAPPIEGGIFLPAFEHELIDLTPQTIVGNTKHGYLTKQIARFEDGFQYPVISGVPNEVRSDTAAVMTTAWLTSTKGHNLRTLMRMMKVGYETILIGPEGEEKNEDLSFLERFNLAFSSTQFRIAYDMNRIVDKKLSESDLRPDRIVTLGESRGAMLERGFDVPAYSGSRRVGYRDVTAPCFARPPKLKELPGVALQLIPEARTLGRLAFELVGQPRLWHYRATMHRDPEYYAKEVFKIPQLLSGDAGTLKKASRDTPGHIRIFKDDGWSQASEWLELHLDDEHVYIEVTHGCHLDIARDDTLNNIELRFQALAEARGFDGEFDKNTIDFDVITALHRTVQKGRRFRPSLKLVD